MSILTKDEIVASIRSGTLIEGGIEQRAQSCSYDMGVGTIFRDGQVIKDGHARSTEQMIIAPGEFVTMLTKEALALPSNVAATAYAINSMSSEGFLVLNPGHVDPGYRGPLSVKAVNLRKVPLALSRGAPIFTIVFQRLDKDAPPYLKNVDISDRERDLNKKDVELSVKSVSSLVALESPFPTKREIDEMISGHWSTRAVFIFTAITLLASIVAAVFAVIPVARDLNKKDPVDPKAVSVESPGKPANDRLEIRDLSNRPADTKKAEDGTKDGKKRGADGKNG